MGTAATQTRQDFRIRERVDALAQALRARDIDGLMAHYAPDVVTFDVLPPARVQGADAYRKNFEAWFSSVRGPIDFEVRDLHITMNDDLAFCHYLGHVRSTRTTGKKSEYWVRVTAGFERMNGRWMITHEHVSLPSSMEALQGS